MTTIILTFIVFVMIGYASCFLVDLVKHKEAFRQETGNNLTLALATPFIFFLSTLGVSDFALSTIIYRKFKLVSDKKLPGTMNTQGVIPFTVMSLFFISTIKVDLLTLFTCIFAQILGSYIGPQFVVKFSASIIRRFIGVGLLLAAFFILAGQLHLTPSAGTAIGLSGIKLVIAAVCLFIFGALNNIGIGSFAPTMMTIYALGLSSAVAYPIMMGASAFSSPVGSLQFIKYGEYSRKITLFSSTFGVLGVLLAVRYISGLDISNLRWIVAGVLLYTGPNMLLEEYKAYRAQVNEVPSLAT
jgi:uncharacterized membrane protein YfcA